MCIYTRGNELTGLLKLHSAIIVVIICIYEYIADFRSLFFTFFGISSFKRCIKYAFNFEPILAKRFKHIFNSLLFTHHLIFKMMGKN